MINNTFMVCREKGLSYIYLNHVNKLVLSISENLITMVTK